MKESLQEATQRALLEGYKNLKENKSKKVEGFDHINDVWNYLEKSKNEEDLEDRIGDIPSKFGVFTYELINNGETARVRNDYEEYGDYAYDEVDIDLLDYLEENKSKKTEAKLEDIQMEIYELIQNGRRLDKQDKNTNIEETIKAIKSDYPNINDKDLKDYVQTKADEIYAGDYDEKTESKKIESVERDFKAEFLALPEKEQERYKKCIPPLRRGLSNVEAKTIAKERGLDAGILWWVTNIGQLTNFKESKKSRS